MSKVQSHRQLSLALRPQGLGMPRAEGHRLRDRSDRAVLRRRSLREALADSPDSGLDRRSHDALRLVGHLSVLGGSLSEADALSARRGRARTRALARGVRRLAHGRRVHLEALERGRDQSVRVGQADRQSGGREDARRRTSRACNDYLESELPTTAFACGDLSIADVALGAMFRNAAMSRYTVDAARWPRLAAYVARVLALEPFVSLARFEDVSRRTSLPQQRAALIEAGAPITAETFGTATPRRGMMPI